ncbi:MAG: NAD(P)/FAD-dependent oxidoreductase, partial [Methanobacteriaceae archaeon]|nr:NAD(P)/FAD-dependent oxidoreductase [Methanobacteriaceae archaeon]
MEEYEIIIIGAGPAGLSAGIYAGRQNSKTLLIDKGLTGGLGLEVLA